jgi:hypothetical protein
MTLEQYFWYFCWPLISASIALGGFWLLRRRL